jgi:23S rRNA-/tRNA-specific pseudouridylate synthase
MLFLLLLCLVDLSLLSGFLHSTVSPVTLKTPLSMAIRKTRHSSSKSKVIKRGKGGRDDKSIRYIHKKMVTADDPKTLFDFMLSLPDTKRSQVKKWLQVGALTVNEAVQSRHDHVLISGDIVAVTAGHITNVHRTSSGIVTKINKAKNGLPLDLIVLYEDEAMIVINKPVNMPLISTSYNKNKNLSKRISSRKEDKISAKAYLDKYLSKKTHHHSRGNVNVGQSTRVHCVHYYDDSYNGIAVFAKNLESKKYLQSQWKSFGVSMAALVYNRCLPSSGAFQNYFYRSRVNSDETNSNNDGKDEHDREIIECYDSRIEAEAAARDRGEKEGAYIREGILAYRTLSCHTVGDIESVIDEIEDNSDGDGSGKCVYVSLLELSLKSTREDEVCTQLAHHGHRVLERDEDISASSTISRHHINKHYQEGSDTEYSFDNKSQMSKRGHRLYIHITEVRIIHPSTKELLVIACDVPSDMYQKLDVFHRRYAMKCKNDKSSRYMGDEEEYNDGDGDGDGDDDGDDDGRDGWAPTLGGDTLKVVTLEQYLSKNKGNA